MVRKNKINAAKYFIKKYKLKKVRRIISGGAKRQDSVYNALKGIRSADYILVHDIARPLVSRKLIETVLNAAKKFGAAIPAIPSQDAVKAGKRFVRKTLEKSAVQLAQTPQAFKYKILKKAYESARKNQFYGNDDASLVEKVKQKVRIIKGDPTNIKITFPADLKIAEEFLKHF